MLMEEVILNIKTCHTVIHGLLDDIDRSEYQNARKQLLVLRHLLINHFFVEEVILYSRFKKKFIRQPRIKKHKVSDPYDTFDKDRTKLIALMKNIDHYTSVGSKIILLTSECAQAKKEGFKECFKAISNLIMERFRFEEDILTEKMVAKIAANKINIKIPVRLAVLDKRDITGTTVNINKTGCLFKPRSPVKDIAVGEIGSLRILPITTSSFFPCKVTRITKDSIAVQALNKDSQDLTEKFKSFM